MELSELSVAVIRLEWGTGGAPRVTKKIAESLDADIFYGYDIDSSSPDEAKKIIDNSLVTKRRIGREIKYMLRMNRIEELREYDLLVQSGNKSGWYVPPENQVVIRYVHNIPTIYSENVTVDSKVGQLYSLLARTMYHHTESMVDMYVCNSEFVERQARRYLGVEESRRKVVYPPVEVDHGNSTDENDSQYYLYLSRLADRKRPIETLKCFSLDVMRDNKLLMAGDGPRRDVVQKYDEKYDNIQYRGYVGDDEKRNLYSNAKALIFPTEKEPFGMVPVEALSFGTPVITVPEGFPQYLVNHGKNGLISESSDPEDIARAVQDFEREGVQDTSDEMIDSVAEFSFNRFSDDLGSAIKEATRKSDTQDDSSYLSSVKDLYRNS